MDKSTTEQIESIAKGKKLRWGALSILLDKIDSTGYWASDEPSFTQWVKSNSHRFELRPPMLWRILSAGRYISKKRNHLKDMGIDIPDLKDLGDDVSPEKIQMLSRMENIVPEHVFFEIAPKVFNGGVTRNELKKIWKRYKPILKGENARGRGKGQPELDLTDPDLRVAQETATAIDSLAKAPPFWTGHDSGILHYEVADHVLADDVITDRGYWLSAVVFLVLDSGVKEYHGVSYVEIASIEDHCEHAEGYAKYCDYYWWIISSGTDNYDEYLKVLPRFTGLMQATDGRINLIKKPEFCAKKEVYADRIPGALLMRYLSEHLQD